MGEQLLFKRSECAWIEKVVATFGTHHWIDDNRMASPLFQKAGDKKDQFFTVQHPDFDRIDHEVICETDELFFDAGEGERIDCADPLGILNREGGEDRGSIAAQGGEGLEIGLDSSPPTPIKSSNCKNGGQMHDAP